jgi:hypothetical protein
VSLSRRGRLRTLLGELGWVNGLLYALNQGLGKMVDGVAVHKYYVIAQPTSRSARLDLAANPSSMEVREIGRSDAVVASFPRPAEVIARRYAQGARCYGAFDGPRLLAFIWMQDRPYDEDEVRCRFSWQPAAQGIWSFDVFVYPEYRFGLTFLRLWHEMERRLQAQGVRWTVSRITAYNARSLASHKRLGFTLCAHCVFVQVKGWQLALVSQAPFVHLSLRPGVGPELVLSLPRAPESGR